MRTLLIALVLISSSVQAQQLEQFNSERLEIDKKLMLTLGGWSLANATVSAIGWARTENEAKYFHQMNTIWSAIDLALAIPGYFKARKADPSSFTFAESWKEQSRSEKTFLFNTALDVAYVSSGLYLRSMAKYDPGTYQQNRGFGNGIILQGGFLFLFDLTAYALHSAHRKNKLDGFLDKVDLSDNGLGIQYKLGNFKTYERSIVEL